MVRGQSERGSETRAFLETDRLERHPFASVAKRSDQREGHELTSERAVAGPMLKRAGARPAFMRWPLAWLWSAASRCSLLGRQRTIRGSVATREKGPVVRAQVAVELDASGCKRKLEATPHRRDAATILGPGFSRADENSVFGECQSGDGPHSLACSLPDVGKDRTGLKP